MSFLSPWVIAIAGAATIPPLVLLYFLKLRRREMPISSTLLWKRAVEDLHVNSPFQRLRNNLLLILQLLVLLLAAVALGKPLLEGSVKHESTLVLLIDQSASMAVEEEGGRTRLEIAKEEAGRLVEAMPDNGRAMVIAFCDRATVVSPFDTDREAVQRKIDSIEQTQSTSTLSEAIALAEAYSQNLIIAGTEAGSDVAPTSAAPPATAVIFSDGRIADAGELSVQRLDAEKIEIVTVGGRSDNAGIVAMAARRNYERPEILEVFATVRNFGEGPMEFDAVLRMRDAEGNSQHVDTQRVRLAPGLVAPGPDVEGEAGGPPPGDAAVPAGSVASVVFDELLFEGGGVLEISLTAEDALVADNRAWAVVRPPRHVQVLLVTEGNLFLERVLPTLPLDVRRMTPAEYEAADDQMLGDGERSLFDVVILDRHSTARLPQAGYLFWGGVPQIEGVSLGDRVNDEVIFNWDESHPVLRHVPVEAVRAWEWYRLTVPSDAAMLMEGETSPVMCTFSREGTDFLISAFPLLIEDLATGEPLMNSTWVTKAHFPVFMYNALQYLSASLDAGGDTGLRTGEPISIPVGGRARQVLISRPDGTRDTVPAAGAARVHYARTRLLGVYRCDGAAQAAERFAVNLFSAAESRVQPSDRLAIGAGQVITGSGVGTVNRPFWPWLLVAALVLLLLEWVVYNKRVFV